MKSVSREAETGAKTNVVKRTLAVRIGARADRLQRETRTRCSAIVAEERQSCVTPQTRYSHFFCPGRKKALKSAVTDRRESLQFHVRFWLKFRCLATWGRQRVAEKSQVHFFRAQCQLVFALVDSSFRAVNFMHMVDTYETNLLLNRCSRSFSSDYYAFIGIGFQPGRPRRRLIEFTWGSFLMQYKQFHVNFTICIKHHAWSCQKQKN